MPTNGSGLDALVVTVNPANQHGGQVHIAETNTTFGQRSDIVSDH